MLVTSSTIIQLCSKLAALSSNQAGLTTDDFLSFANLVTTTLVAELLGAREEFLIYQDCIPVLCGQAAYRIPYRSINGIVRHLWFEDSTGKRHRLYGKAIEDVEGYSNDSTGVPGAFYVIGNSLVLLPTPNVTGNLVVAYPFRPNQLVDGITTQSIQTMPTSNSVTIANIPANFVSGALYDIIDDKSGNGIIYYDQMGTVTTAGGDHTISFPTDIRNAQPGHHIALANQTPVVMLPEEGHALLLEMTIMRIEMLRGNAARIKNSTVIIQDTRRAWDELLNNRMISKPHPAGSGGLFPRRPF